MILIKHELKQGWKSLAVWTASIGFFIIICVFLYPEMKGEMEDMNEMFSSMGAFSSAFGMDRLNFGTLIGFYATECGNILGLGGAFFASLIAVSSLAKEEKEHTAEFLFAHPISRKKILTEKLTSVLFQLLILNVIVFLFSVGSISLIGEEILWKEICLQLRRSRLTLNYEIIGMFWNLRIPAPQRTRHRTWHCHNDVFPEHYCQYLRSGKISEIYHPVWLCKRSRYC